MAKSVKKASHCHKHFLELVHQSTNMVTKSTKQMRVLKIRSCRQKKKIKIFKNHGVESRDGDVTGWNESFPIGQHWLLVLFQAKLC